MANCSKVTSRVALQAHLQTLDHVFGDSRLQGCEGLGGPPQLCHSCARGAGSRRRRSSRGRGCAGAWWWGCRLGGRCGCPIGAGGCCWPLLEGLNVGGCDAACWATACSTGRQAHFNCCHDCHFNDAGSSCWAPFGSVNVAHCDAASCCLQREAGRHMHVQGQTRVPSEVVCWGKPSRRTSVQCRSHQRQEASCDVASTCLLTAAADAAVQTCCRIGPACLMSALQGAHSLLPHGAAL